MLSQTAHTSTGHMHSRLRISANVSGERANYIGQISRSRRKIVRTRRSKVGNQPARFENRERYRPEIVTIAIVPATDAVQTTKLPKFAAKLRNALERLGKGSAFILDEKAAGRGCAEGFRRVETAFYRSKLTSWMTRIEEEHRFVLFVGDRSGQNASNRSSSSSGWSRVCVSQADLVLVVARKARLGRRRSRLPLPCLRCNRSQLV